MSKIVDLIGKESGYQNESNKVCEALRLVLLTSIVISVCQLIVELVSMKGMGAIGTGIALAIFVILLIYSYKGKAKPILIACNILWLPWIGMQVRLFGWSIGAQQLIFVLCIVSVLCYYISTFKKILIEAGLILYCVSLYIFSRCVTPLAELNDVAIAIIYIGILITVMASVALISSVYVKENQAEEGKLVKYNIQLENQANTDALTGLYNRRRIKEKLNEIYIENDPLGFCVAMCDIDFFKHVNDNYGHDIGDEVLKKVANTLKETIVGDDTMARWGGEEFLIVFPHCNGDQAMTKLIEFQHKIRSLEFNVLDRSFSVTMTIGLAEYDFESDVEKMIKMADEKMYHGKENGRNQIVF